MLGAVFSLSFYSILVKKYMHYFPAYATIFAMSGISTILLLPFVVVEWMALGVPPLINVKHLVGLVYLGVFPSVIALIFYNKAVSHIGASLASLFLNLLTVITLHDALF